MKRNENTTYPTVKPGEANLNHIKRQAGWLSKDPNKRLTIHEVLSACYTKLTKPDSQPAAKIWAMGFASFPHSDRNTILVENGSKWCAGSGFLRPINGNEEDDEARDCKVAKTETTHHHQYHMLSFSSPNTSQAAAAATYPYYYPSSTPFTRNTGYGSTVVTRMRGPFTPSQWMELEHQALIYKYIASNVPIPSSLLNPIRRAFESVGFPSLITSNALGWGAFHLGFSSTDPEPGRCRRTDGKKWRCSRDAVADQKYCERHMNRGRHRSRKPVEGQSGIASTTANAAKPTPVLPPPASGGASSGHDLQPSTNRSAQGVYQDAAELLMMSSKARIKGNGYNYSYSASEFGLVCSDSLLNPLNPSLSSLVNHTTYISSNHGDKSSTALRHFIDEPSALFSMQPERTQLSISIPPATSDFMSSTSSPTNDKLDMGLGMGRATSQEQQRHTTANWLPISWEPSMGGPLGEALHAATGECRIIKPLNLRDSPRPAASSPTGVLQRGAFGSLSNSSTASSPRAESGRTLDGGGLILPQTNYGNDHQLIQLQQ